MKKIVCDLCGDSNYFEKYITQDRSFPVGDSFHLVKCRGCGLLYLNPQPEMDDLIPHYPSEEYYAYQDEEIQINYKRKLKAFRDIRKKIKIMIKKFFIFFKDEFEKEINQVGPNLRNAKVLDVGCGAGEDLKLYKNLGAVTYGVEINPKACEIAKKKGHQIFCGTLLEAKFKNDFFDIVRFNHSLEHMFSPKEILTETKRILKKGGAIWISIPNHGSLHAKLFGKWFYAIDSPRHLFGFTPLTLKLLINLIGLKIEHIHTYSFTGGFTCSLEFWLNDRIKRKNKFYQGDIKIKWWYFIIEIIMIFPRVIIDLLNQGEAISICARKI